jgi:DNA-binding YbaB/EbfC family protein
MMPGMPDLGQLLQQAQQMQAEMERAQASLAESEVTGSAGNGLVNVVVNGSGDLLRLRIDPSVVDPEDIETLEDLIVAAVHDARRSAEAIASTAMNSVAGSLDLSSMGLSGMGLPGFGAQGQLDQDFDDIADDELDDEDDDDDDLEDDEDDVVDEVIVIVEDEADDTGGSQSRGDLPPGSASPTGGV